MATNSHDDEHGSRFDYWDAAAPAWEELDPSDPWANVRASAGVDTFDSLDFDPYDDWYASGGEMLETVNSYAVPGVIIVDSPPWLHSALYSDYQDPSDDGDSVDIPASVLRALTPED